GSHLLVYRKEFLSLKLFHPRVEARGFLVSYAPRTKLTKVINKTACTIQQRLDSAGSQVLRS
ncbi:hypothetical protein ACWOE8_22510, partial [Enterococcus avium]